MEIALDHDLRWNKRGKLSKIASPSPLNDLDKDETSVAEALVLLAYSHGGFCDSYAATTPTPPKKRQELALIAAVEIQNAAAAPTPTSPKKRPELALIAAVNAVEIQSAAAATPTPPQKRQELALVAAVDAVEIQSTAAATPTPPKKRQELALIAAVNAVEIQSAAAAKLTPPQKRQELALIAAVNAVEIQSAAAAKLTPPQKSQELALIAAVNAVEIQSAAAAATPTPLQKRQELALIAAVSPKNQEGTSPDTPLMKNHDCRVCGQVFRSSRALGGHMTSHRAKTPSADDMGRRSSADASGRVHECPLCHETFATGQALGGHKRKHNEGPALARKALKFTSDVGFAGETSRGGGDTSHVRPLFDLNLPAPEEE